MGMGLNVGNKPDSEYWMSKYYNIYFLVEKVQMLGIGIKL